MAASGYGLLFALLTSPQMPQLANWGLAYYASFAYFASFAYTAFFAYLGHLVLARPRNSRLGPSGPTRLLCLLRFLCVLWPSSIGPLVQLKNLAIWLNCAIAELGQLANWTK